MTEDTEIQEEDKKLSMKQQRFADSYLSCLNASKAAIDAGYSKKSCRSAGSDLLTKANIRKYIATRMKEAAMDEMEATKRIADFGRSNLADYMTTIKVEKIPKVEKKLSVIIRELEDEINFENELCGLLDYTEVEYDNYVKSQRLRNHRLIRYKLELKKNKKATRIVNDKPIMVNKTDLDLNKIVADKEGARIKSFSHTPTGIKVEMYGADEAVVNILKMHGKFEKDNKQKTPDVSPVQIIQLPDNGRNSSNPTESK